MVSKGEVSRNIYTETVGVAQQQVTPSTSSCTGCQLTQGLSRRPDGPSLTVQPRVWLTRRQKGRADAIAAATL